MNNEISNLDLAIFEYILTKSIMSQDENSKNDQNSRMTQSKLEK